MTTATVQVSMSVPFERVINCIIGTLEGGYSPWIHAFLPAGDEASDRAMNSRLVCENGVIWYARESFWINGGKADIIYDLAAGREGNGGGNLKVTLTALQNGLNIMAEKEARHFADLIAENDDAVTHDVFMQMLMFGEIVYG